PAELLRPAGILRPTGTPRSRPMVRAVVLPAVSAPLEVAEIALPEPGPGQVRVRLSAAGVCHSDLSLANGTLRQPVPAVLGHEGAGTVVSVGAGSDGDGATDGW